MPDQAIIEPKTLKGFRDLLPDQEIVRRRLLQILEQVMVAYGFVPIDTPVLEYTEVLLGKGGGETDKQVFRFTTAGDRDVSMRFDLTVPFARFMAGHLPELYLPFKRYHFAKVWRGENAQKGRYREFIQCDFDLVGVDAPGADFEILLVMNRAFKAMGVDSIQFHVSHRGLFNRFLDFQGIREHSVEILRRVDKLKKIGVDATRELLAELVEPVKAQKILDFIQSSGANAAILDQLDQLSGGVNPDSERLRAILGLAEAVGIAERFVIDPSITRGLDYYTGIVYETFLTDLPGIGSVCSGGRYDNLAGLYTKELLPGVGSSIGLDRLMAGLEELGQLDLAPAGTRLLILCQSEDFLGRYHALAETLRGRGVDCEVYPTAKKLGQQFAYAEKKRIPFGIICGATEFAAGTLNLKNLLTRESFEGIDLERAIGILSAR